MPDSNTPTPSVGVMLKDLHGMYHSAIQQVVRSKVLPLRFRVAEYLLVKLAGHRFAAEHDLVWDLVCCSSTIQIATAFSEYRRHPAKRNGLISLVLGSGCQACFDDYFRKLEREWTSRNNG